MTFGGFDSSGASTDYVYLVDIDLNTTCVHSNLPLVMKETHAFEYNDTLLVCSSFTFDGLICNQRINLDIGFIQSEMLFQVGNQKKNGFHTCKPEKISVNRSVLFSMNFKP